jgi:hypothetical protein
MNIPEWAFWISAIFGFFFIFTVCIFEHKKVTINTILMSLVFSWFWPIVAVVALGIYGSRIVLWRKK